MKFKFFPGNTKKCFISIWEDLGCQLLRILIVQLLNKQQADGTPLYLSDNITVLSSPGTGDVEEE